jgi:protein SCO1/2
MANESKMNDQDRTHQSGILANSPLWLLSGVAVLLVVLSSQTISSFDKAVSPLPKTGEDVNGGSQVQLNSVSPSGELNLESESKRSATLPNVVLVDHEGKSIRFRDDLILGKKVAINFMYTVCNGICPGMTQNIRKVRQELGARGINDITFISISIEPEQDTPERLQKYRENNKIEDDPSLCPWIFLTGDLNDIEQVRKSLGVYDPDPIIDADRRQHGGTLTYGNDLTDWWGATPALQKTELLFHTLVRNVADNKRMRPKITASN